MINWKNKLAVALTSLCFILAPAYLGAADEKPSDAKKEKGAKKAEMAKDGKTDAPKEKRAANPRVGADIAALMGESDGDDDGQLSKEEFSQMAEKLFPLIDVDKSESLGREEIMRFFSLVGRTGGAAPSMAGMKAKPDESQETLFDRRDVDGDGLLSAKEVGKSSDLMDKLDANKDGFLDKTEAKMWTEKSVPPSSRADWPKANPNRPRGIMATDANGDGFVTEEEVPEQMRRFFGKMDANQDGKISQEEAEALQKKSEALRLRQSGQGQRTPRP